MAQSAPDTPERYKGTAADFSRVLAMRQTAAYRATERDRAEARTYAETAPVANQGDPTATEFLRKMLKAETLGIARWTGTPMWSSEPAKWILNTDAALRSTWKPNGARMSNRRCFTELDIRRAFRKVRRTSPDSWTACCPAHNDRHPSMTIRRGRTRWLFKCWSQECSWIEILQAVGLGNVDTRLGVNR